MILPFLGSTLSADTSVRWKKSNGITLQVTYTLWSPFSFDRHKLNIKKCIPSLLIS